MSPWSLGKRQTRTNCVLWQVKHRRQWTFLGEILYLGLAIKEGFLKEVVCNMRPEISRV